MSRRPTASALSSFSTLPSMSSIGYISQMLSVTDREDNVSTLSGSTLAESTLLASSSNSTLDSQNMVVKGIANAGATGFDELVPIVQEVAEALARDLPMCKKKKKSLARVVKKAGILAARKMGVPKTWTQRHSKLSISPHVQEEPEVPQEEPVVFENLAAIESTDSLTVEFGSPGNLNTCPTSPPLCARDSIEVTRLHQALALRAHCPPRQAYLSPLQLQVLRLVAKVFLFIPYTILVGFLPFLWPNALSLVVFSPIINIVPGPLTPNDKFVYHARLLPYHVGVSLGFLFVVLWSLGILYPGFAVSLFAAFAGRTMWAWGDYEFVPDVNQANLGVDDQSTIIWLLRGFVFGDLMHSWKDFGKQYRESEAVEDGDDDIEMETLEREGTQGIDFVIRLKDRPHECLRIVVDSEETTD